MQPDFRFIRWRGKFAVEWYDETGRRFRRSLGTTDRGEAKRRLTDEFIPAFHKASRPSDVAVAYAWEVYRSALGDKPAATTMKHEWKAIGEHFAETTASAITEADCQSYIRFRRQAGRKDGTIWTELGHLRSALRYAAEKNLIDKAPKDLSPRTASAARQANDAGGDPSLPRRLRISAHQTIRHPCDHDRCAQRRASGAHLGSHRSRGCGSSNWTIRLGPEPKKGAPWCR